MNHKLVEILDRYLEEAGINWHRLPDLCNIDPTLKESWLKTLESGGTPLQINQVAHALGNNKEIKPRLDIVLRDLYAAARFPVRKHTQDPQLDTIYDTVQYRFSLAEHGGPSPYIIVGWSPNNPRLERVTNRFGELSGEYAELTRNIAKLMGLDVYWRYSQDTFADIRSGQIEMTAPVPTPHLPSSFLVEGGGVVFSNCINSIQDSNTKLYKGDVFVVRYKEKRLLESINFGLEALGVHSKPTVNPS